MGTIWGSGWDYPPGEVEVHDPAKAATERAQMLLNGKNHWMDRAVAAEERVAQLEAELINLAAAFDNERGKWVKKYIRQALGDEAVSELPWLRDFS